MASTTVTTPATPTLLQPIVDALFTALAVRFAGRPLISFAIAEVHQLVDDGILTSAAAALTPPAAPVTPTA